MRSRWKQVVPFEPDKEYVVLASRIPPRRYRSTFRLFRGSRLVSAQLSETDGVIGFSLLARPLRKEYATMSVWVDEAALERFARSGPHGRLAADLTAEMAHTTFVRWTIRGDAGRPSWKETLARLGTEGALSAPRPSTR